MRELVQILQSNKLGYWSDEGYEGSFFGKLTWDPDDPTWGQIHCWDAGDMKTAYVKKYVLSFSLFDLRERFNTLVLFVARNIVYIIFSAIKGYCSHYMITYNIYN